MENIFTCLLVASVCPIAAAGILACKKGFSKGSGAYFTYVTSPTAGLAVMGPFLLFMLWLRNENPSLLLTNTPLLAFFSGWFVAMLALALHHVRTK